MAARLTDRQRKRIIADYINAGSYNAVAKMHGVSRQTVKNICDADSEIGRKLQEKKEKNTQDILKYMESKRDVVCDIIGKGLNVLADEEKLKKASPAQITIALGTLIDKFTATNRADDAEAQRGIILMPEVNDGSE